MTNNPAKVAMNADASVATDQSRNAHAYTMRTPARSTSHPAPIWLIAYVQKKPDNKIPSDQGDKCSSVLSNGAATARLPRAKNAMHIATARRKRSPHGSGFTLGASTARGLILFKSVRTTPALRIVPFLPVWRRVF